MILLAFQVAWAVFLIVVSTCFAIVMALWLAAQAQVALTKFGKRVLARWRKHRIDCRVDDEDYWLDMEALVADRDGGS